MADADDLIVVPVPTDSELGDVAVVLVPDGDGVPGGAVRLDDLLDVDAPPSSPGVLTRGTDGRVAPIPIEDVRTDWFSGDGPPDVVLGAKAGDVYLDRLTGELYRLA